MPTYSPSKLALFEQCPRRYFYVSVARVPGEPTTMHPATFMGSRVHEALEHLYSQLRTGRVLTVDELLAWFHQRWAERWRTEPASVAAWDSAARWESTGADCLRRYHSLHQPFDADETLGIERFVEFPLDPDGTIRICGFIDRLARTRDGTVRVHDYKTQEGVPAQEEVDSDEQLAFYELAVRHELSHSGPVELVWHFIRAGVTRTSRRTPEQLARLRSDAISLIREIESRTAQGDRFEPKPSRLCQWCEHRKRCPASVGTGATP